VNLKALIVKVPGSDDTFYFDAPMHCIQCEAEGVAVYEGGDWWLLNCTDGKIHSCDVKPS
jgi:hypothetical protein